MENIKERLSSEFLKGYSLFDRLFFIGMLLLQIIVFILHPDSLIGIISGISGVISVVLCAKGKISFYYIGFIQTISYLFLAWDNRFYGEVIENIFYLVTMVWGIFIWQKSLTKTSDGSTQVIVKRFTVSQWILSIIGTTVATIIMGYWLNSISSSQPYTDAATNIFAIFAQLLMIKRYKEQWIWWLLIDMLCIKMWFVAGNWSMVAMYIAWTVNCIYGWYNWSKLNKLYSE